MSENPVHSPSNARETTLRLLMLGAIYALAVFFVIAFSPSMGFIASHPTGEIGRVAAAPEAASR